MQHRALQDVGRPHPAPTPTRAYVVHMSPRGPLLRLHQLHCSDLRWLYRAFHVSMRRDGRRGLRLTPDRGDPALLSAAVNSDLVPHIHGSSQSLKWTAFVAYYNTRRRSASLPPVAP